MVYCIFTFDAKYVDFIGMLLNVAGPHAKGNFAWHLCHLWHAGVCDLVPCCLAMRHVIGFEGNQRGANEPPHTKRGYCKKL